MMQNMAAMGRYGDTQMAHVAPGEMVVPGPVLNQNPALKQGIVNAIGQAGADPTRYMVGSPTGSYNPATGQQEFFFDAIAKGIGAIFGGGGGGSILNNPFVSSAIASGIGGLLGGQKPKDALRTALIGGALGGVGSQFMGGEAPQIEGLPAGAPQPPAPRPANLGQKVAETVGRSGAARPVDDRLLGIGRALTSIAPSLEGTKIVDFLSTPVGEALAFSLGSGLMSKFDKEEEQPRSRAFGGTTEYIPYGQAGMQRMAAGGMVNGQYFPRRNGGIMPHEGSGQKDDVPAMLMAGEFVLTKNAVKGLGNGDQERGIQKAYRLMDKLEDMA